MITTAKRRPFVTHASITARPFFERRGYVMVEEQRVLRKGVCLSNYIMQKGIRYTEVLLT